MHTDDYLWLGLNALARAPSKDYFADGHRGGAVLSACFLAREEQLEPGVAECMAEIIQRRYAGTDLCAPFPDERPLPDAAERIIAAVTERIDGLRQAGHNVILPTLALKALAALPEAATPSRVAGICALARAFTARDPLDLEPGDDLPLLSQQADPAATILREFLRTGEAFAGRGQGWTGHLLTYGRALLDLGEFGYGRLASLAEPGFQLYLKRIRLGPLDTDRPRPEHGPAARLPHHLDYWQPKRDVEPGLGHLFKYPYGLYGLAARTGDAALVEQCWQASWRVF